MQYQGRPPAANPPAANAPPVNPHYPLLFSPFTLSGRVLRNRVIHSSITPGISADGALTDELLAYYVNRARGGARAIVSEPLGRGLPAPLANTGLISDARSAAADLLAHPGTGRRIDGTAVLLDIDHTTGTYALAELLAARFARVVLATPRDTIATEVATVKRQGILRRLHAAGVTVLPLAEAVPDACFADNARLPIRHVYGGSLATVDDLALFTYATPRAPDIALRSELGGRVEIVQAVGDCAVARDIFAARADGLRVGNAL